ncbi:unnamed protein product [Closterium sp. NIES-53]
MTTLWVLLHVAARRDYELHSLDFSTAFLQGSLHEEIWLRRPPGFTGSFPVGTQWSLRRPVDSLRQAPCQWHDTPRTTLAALGFTPSTADSSLFSRTDTTLPPFYVLVYVDDLVFATGDTEALAHEKSELQKRHTCTDLGPSALRIHVLLTTVHSSAYSTSGMGLVLGGQARVVLTGHADASWVDDLATQRTSQGSSCEAEIYAGAMAAQELRWLTYLLTDLGEAPLSSCSQRGQLRLAYVASQANTANVFTKALQPCDHQPYFTFLDWSCDLLFSPTLPMGVEHTTKHIALRYFLAQELQQRGQLLLAYVATQANTADIFTKALQPGDHQRFCYVLGLVPPLPHLLTA